MDQSSSIIQFEISPVYCNKASHNEDEIKALCLRTECNETSAQCFMCVQELHKGCQGSMKMCKDVPQMVIPLQSMISELLELKVNMNLKMNKLIKLIEETLLPITQYSEYPNLTNLNKLGTFLKLEIEAKTKNELEKVEEEIKSLFQQCKNNLFKKSAQEIEYQALEQKSIEFMYFQVQQLIKEGKQDEALKMVEATLLQNQNDKRLLLNQGLILYELRKYKQAIDCYDIAIQIDSVYQEAWQNKGLSLNELERYQEAIICFDQAINIDKNNAFAWSNKGYSLNQLKRYQEAIICLDQAIKINPNFAYARLNKGINHLKYSGLSLNKLKRYQEAIICLDQAIKIDPNYACDWSNKGINHLKYSGYSLNELQRYQEAIICSDQAIKIDPNYAYAWFNKGINFLKYSGYSLNQLKRYQEAIPCLEQAIKLKPNFQNAIIGLEIAERELKKTQQVN